MIYQISTGTVLECDVKDVELAFNFSDLGSFSFSIDVPRTPINDKVLGGVVSGSGDNLFGLSPLPEDLLTFSVSIDRVDFKSWSINLVSLRKSLANSYKGSTLGSVIDYKDLEFYNFVNDLLDEASWHADSACFGHTITATAKAADNHDSLSYVVSNSAMAENLASTLNAPASPHNHDISPLTSRTLLAQTSLGLFFKSLFKRFLGIDATVNIPNDLCLAYGQFVNARPEYDWGGYRFGQIRWVDRNVEDFMGVVPNYEHDSDKVDYIAHGTDYLHGDEVDNQDSEVSFVRSKSFSVQASGWYSIEFSTQSLVPRFDNMSHQYNFCDLLHYYGYTLGTFLEDFDLDAFIQEVQLCKVDAAPRMTTKVFTLPNTIMESSRTSGTAGANLKVSIQAMGKPATSFRSFQQFPVLSPQSEDPSATVSDVFRLYDDDDEDYLVCFRTGVPQRWLEQPGLYHNAGSKDTCVTSPYNASLMMPNFSAAGVQYADASHDFGYTITPTNVSSLISNAPVIYTGRYGKQRESDVKFVDVFGNDHYRVDQSVQRGLTESSVDSGSYIYDIYTGIRGTGSDEFLIRNSQFVADVFLEAGKAYEFRIASPSATFNWYGDDIKLASPMGVHEVTIESISPLKLIPWGKTDATPDNTPNAYYADTFYNAFKDLSVDTAIKLVDALNLSTTKDDFLHFGNQANNSAMYDIHLDHIKVEQGAVVTETEAEELDDDINVLRVPLCTYAEGDPDFPAAPGSSESGSASVPLCVKHTASYMTDGFKAKYPKYPVIFKQDLSESGGQLKYGIQGHRITTDIDYQPRYLKPTFVDISQLESDGLLGVSNYVYVFDVLYKDITYIFNHPYVFYQGYMYLIKEVGQYNVSTGLAEVSCVRLYREETGEDDGLHDSEAYLLFDSLGDKLYSAD